MNKIKAVSRLLKVLLHLASGLLTIRRVFPRLDVAQRDARVQQWAQQMLDKLGIDLQVLGTPAALGPVLLVANHISWLDILVVHAARPCRFISKSDIRRWPVIGTLASAAGTLFIERSSSRDAMRVVHAMAASLDAADVLAIFPEGTTGDGNGVLPFHANLLQAAIASKAPVQPVALSFSDVVTGRSSLVPCYIGNDTLVRSVWRTLCARNLRATVRFGALQYADARERRAWAADLRAEIIAMRD